MNYFKSLVICWGLLLVFGCNGGNSTPTIKLDGSIDKWLSKAPAWENGPAPADKSPDDFHVRKVFFDNDSRYFYVFIQCSPTIQERYKLTKFSGSLGDIYFDAENNPNTGSPLRWRDTNPQTRGYKVKVYLPTGNYSSTSGDGGAFAAYSLYRFTGKNLEDNSGFNSEIPNSSQSSMDSGSLIVDGKDGVEMAIPLEMLGLKPGATARIMIEPSILDPKVGFVTYRCR